MLCTTRMGGLWTSNVCYMYEMICVSMWLRLLYQKSNKIQPWWEILYKHLSSLVVVNLQYLYIGGAYVCEFNVSIKSVN